MNQTSYLSNIDPSAIEGLYQQYLLDKDSIDIYWQKFFEGFNFALDKGKNLQGIDKINDSKVIEHIQKEASVLNLIKEYRTRGHLFAKTNPIRRRRIYSPPITIDRFGLTSEDLDQIFQVGKEIGLEQATLSDIIKHLENTYCRSIGCEYTTMRDPNSLTWMSSRLEEGANTPTFSKEQKLNIINILGRTVLFEQFMHNRFVGQKRFSLEGLEAIIPALQTVIESGSDYGIKEFVFGMAHRGRLNILANIFQKDYQDIFSEFEAKGYEDDSFVGDVKYHMGYSNDIVTQKNKVVHLSMLPNPSHLEAVNSVAMGATRGKLDNRYKLDKDSIVSIIIHGDASISGQGIIYENLQMSQLPAYAVGGVVHIVMNNQIGFTTNYLEGRSSTYCTDIAKVGLCPTFHVNGDDIEAVVHTVLLALEFRQAFKRDVFIDILGYRKYGHNEGDDPKFTQPILYDLIEKHKNPLDIYSEKLITEEVIDLAYVKKMREDFLNLLDEKLDMAKKMSNTPIAPFLKGDWQNIKRPSVGDLCKNPQTGISKETLDLITNKLTSLPENKPFLKKIHNMLDEKRKLVFEKNKVDWSTAEALAFGSLLLEKYNIRFSGQDVLRGTFSHRHAMLRSNDESLDYYPLKNLAEVQGNFFIFNSLLSEYGVLGFEYGYALTSPKTLTLWEAQFGDFANGAQIIIDQFISVAESKWQKMNGIVLLLPHGQEGQGPEHSSARVERFLQLCAKDNMIVANASNPANYFHLLRRQLLSQFRKPLVVFTPKSLIRNPACLSDTNNFLGDNQFLDIIDDEVMDKKTVENLILCSGKIYYDLSNYRVKNDIKNTAIIRIEQLYPFDSNLLNSIIDKYTAAKKVTWVQEEPERQGPMMFIDCFWKDKKFKLNFVSRNESPTTAPGFVRVFNLEQDKVLKQAFL